MIKLLLFMIAKLLVILTGLVSIFIIYPLGVLIPFIWNFRWNPKGWIFEKFECEELAVIQLFGIGEDKKWTFYSEEYPTFIHFLIGVFMNDPYSYTVMHYFEIINNGKTIGLGAIDKDGNTVVDIETTTTTTAAPLLKKTE